MDQERNESEEELLEVVKHMGDYKPGDDIEHLVCLYWLATREAEELGIDKTIIVETGPKLFVPFSQYILQKIEDHKSHPEEDVRNFEYQIALKVREAADITIAFCHRNDPFIGVFQTFVGQVKSKLSRYGRGWTNYYLGWPIEDDTTKTDPGSV
jgi:hypothetical protein